MLSCPSQLKFTPLKGAEKEMSKIRAFINDESGMETLEYAVIAGLIAVVAVLVYGSGWGAALRDRLLDATAVAAPAAP